jgi:hypothetical protein
MISDSSGSTDPAGSVTCFSSQVDDLVATIEASRPSVEPSPLTPAPAVQYRISEPNEDDSDDSDCEEYYDFEASQIKGKEIPQWARADNVIALLEKQQRVDPDRIFINCQRTCDLTALFEKKKRPFTAPRGESGAWDQDGLTPEEEMDYKRKVGLA